LKDKMGDHEVRIGQLHLEKQELKTAMAGAQIQISDKED